jgi:hypothetical protein
MLRRNRAVAWTVSALAHVLLVGALLLRKPAPIAAPEVGIEIEIAETSRKPDPAPVVATRPDDDAPMFRNKSTRRSSGRAHVAPEIASTAGVVADDDRPSELSVPDAPPGPAPDLSLRGLPAGVQEKLVGPPPPVAVIERRWRRPTVDQLREELERTEDAIANVEAGRVDPLLFDYLRGAKARLEPEARRIAEGIAMGVGDTARGWGRGYLRRIEQVGRGNARRDEPPDLRDPAAMRRPDLFRAYNEAAHAAEAGAAQWHAEICLDVAAGRETRAMLRGRSGLAEFDRLALASFEKSVALRPVPPDARAGRACYDVRLAVFRAPPVPVLGCSIDFMSLPTCTWPGKKLIKVTSELATFELPHVPGAKRSLLRAAR